MTDYTVPNWQIIHPVYIGWVEEEELERLLMAHSPKLPAIVNAARERFRSGAGIPHETFWREVEAENADRGKKRNSRPKNGRTIP
jgi:hypothetical protein